MKEFHAFIYKKNRLQQIKGFYYTAKLRSISEAANAMRLTQSTVTLQIQSLERDLNLKLLDRNSKPISLTKDGESFYEKACPLMHEFESVVENFLNSKNLKQQKNVNIAVHHIAISYLMPKIISVFKKTHPDSKITIHNLSPSEAITKLKEGKVDLAFYPNTPHDSEIERIETVSYDPILIMNQHHPLAKKKITSLKDLKDFDLIRIDSGLIALPLFEEAIKNYQLGGSIEFENGNWEMLKHFVKENNFVAIVSTVCLDHNDQDLVVKNLTHFFPKMGYMVMHRKGEVLKPVIKSFIESIKEIAETKSYSSN